MNMNETTQLLVRYSETLKNMSEAQSDAEYEQALVQHEESREALLAGGHQFHFGENGTYVWSVSVETNTPF
jgi:hypothetical protein